MPRSFDPYARGRQFQRFHKDHAELLYTLREEDWYWIIQICSLKAANLDEERYPVKWTSCKRSMTSALYRWRMFMRDKHPYKGTRIRRRQERKTKLRRIAERHIKSNFNSGGKETDQKETTKMNRKAEGHINYRCSSEEEGIDYGDSESE
jgi:hypothetical protein